MKRMRFHEEILEQLHQDHRTVASLLEELCATTSRATKKRARLFAILDDELSRHAKAEQELIYPRLQGVKETERDGFAAEEEHGLMRHLLVRLRHLAPDDERWLPTLSVLKETVERHVEHEETKIFKEIRHAFDQDELRLLPDEFRTAKGELTALSRSA